MATLKLPDCDLFYLVDDFTDPWTQPETVLMLHGNAESSLSWYAWVPLLARHYQVLRPDMRGYGQSTPMPRDYVWTFDKLIDDYCRLMDSLMIERFHLVAAKIGGTVARVFAARRPDRMLSLTVVGTPQAKRPGAEQIPALIEEYETYGAEHWARRTMNGRLGEHFPAEGVEWWTKFMGRAPVSSLIGFNRGINYADISAELPKIKCPTLVVTTEESGLGTVERTREWQQQIADSRLQVLPGKSYHVAASDAEACAQATLAFMRDADPKTKK